MGLIVAAVSLGFVLLVAIWWKVLAIESLMREIATNQAIGLDRSFNAVGERIEAVHDDVRAVIDGLRDPETLDDL